jgi:hypothetical protein
LCFAPCVRRDAPLRRYPQSDNRTPSNSPEHPRVDETAGTFVRDHSFWPGGCMTASARPRGPWPRRPIASVSLPSTGVRPHDGVAISAAAKRARPKRSCEGHFALCANSMNPKEAGDLNRRPRRCAASFPCHWRKAKNARRPVAQRRAGGFRISPSLPCAPRSCSADPVAETVMHPCPGVGLTPA